MQTPQTRNASSSAVMFAFACVYICWGATYTAARLGVHFVPAPALAGVRLLIGSSLMLGFMALRGKRLLGSVREMRRLFILGVLMLFFGNVGLVWAEFYLPSGLAALLVAIIPVYIAVIEWLMPHGERLRTRGEIGLVLGFVGLVVLAFPSARTGFRGDWHQLAAIIILLLGALSFSVGSVWSRGTRFSLDPLSALDGDDGRLPLRFTAGDLAPSMGSRHMEPAESVSAITFLVLFGSLTGYSAYTWLLQNVPVSKVATYAYVNPMVAVLLGAVLLGERMHGNEWIGMVMILLAVFLVTSSKMQPNHEAPEIESMEADS